MSAHRRDSSQSPDGNSGHGMGGSMKNGVDMVPNGPMMQQTEYDQWRHSMYTHHGGMNPPSSNQQAPVTGDYMTNYYAPFPYDHHGGWTQTAGFYHHPQGLGSPVNSPYMDHLTLFGGGAPAQYNYFPPGPTNGGDYNAWGGPSIVATPPRTVSKNSEFYYGHLTDGYSNYAGTDITGGSNGQNQGRIGVSQQQQQQQQQQYTHLDQNLARMSVYDDVNTSRGPPMGGVGSVNVYSTGVHYNNGTSALNNSAPAEPKKKSWATIASQPAKPNSCSGIGGPFGAGKSRGRVPIGGVPGSTSISTSLGGTTGSSQADSGFWGSPAAVPSTNTQSPQAVPPPPTSVIQQNLSSSGGAQTNVGAQSTHHQRAYGGGLAKNVTGANSSWTTKSTSSTNEKPPATTEIHTAVNGGSENGEYNNNNSTGGNKNEKIPAVNDAPKTNVDPKQQQQQGVSTLPHPILNKLAHENEYNPKELSMATKGARYFVIKSYSEDDIHRSIKYGIWCSTEHGNKRLDSAYREREAKGPIYLLYSVNGSGHFCGVAQMTSPLDYNKSSGVWAQDKWKGQFTVKWIYVKDVPNAQLRHIRLENNENKPVTNSRDTQEVPPEKGRQVMKIVHSYLHTTSLFDDFGHYEKRQEEEDHRKGKRLTGSDE